MEKISKEQEKLEEIKIDFKLVKEEPDLETSIDNQLPKYALEVKTLDNQKLEDEIKSIQDYNSTIKKRKAEMKDSVQIIEEIIKDEAISDANLRLLVDKIIIFEKDKKMSIKIKLNAKFQKHKDCYDENGNLKDSAFTV